MKFSTLAYMTICVLLLQRCTSSEKDSVKQAQEQNQNSAIDNDISEFLTKAADARMMDIEQGKLASARGTTPEIKQYGERMIKDQTKLLHEIRVLAASKNIALPATLSEDKADGLEDLREKEADAFDKKFIRMMTIDHKRDVREFEDATEFKDRDVQKFATTYLPLIEAHLEQVQELKDKTKAELSEREEGEDNE
jgi:putative membrane protein